MKCAWDCFIKLLPFWMRDKVDELGKNALQELRLRINAPPELVFQERSIFLARCVTATDIQFCINLATKYSPWSSETVADGFITVQGGHRIGLCGTVIPSSRPKGFISVTSVCIRVARDYYGIAKGADVDGSLLIIGKPSAGKTTFLRDLIRQLAKKDKNRVAVVDERYEIFPIVEDSFCFNPGVRVDVIAGCNKAMGIEMVLRCMAPTIIAIDEITSKTDSEAMLHCIGCGVSMIATAHASSMEEFKIRPIYSVLLDRMVFQWLVILHSDKTWHMEQISI